MNNDTTAGGHSSQKPALRIAQLDEIPAVPCPCGEARRAFHGVDRILPGSSTLIPGSGRLNLTLRRAS